MAVLFEINTGTAIIVLYHVSQKFSDVAPLIAALAGEDKSFAALLVDFEELSTWLAVKGNLSNPDDGEIACARELIRELETDIRQQLEEYSEHAR